MIESKDTFLQSITLQVEYNCNAGSIDMDVNLISGQQGEDQVEHASGISSSGMVAAGTAPFVFTTAMPSNLLIPTIQFNAMAFNSI